ncbi:hypothetical protein [Candidatus Pseudothioglobus singularis]|uniref:Uncharacterized protein n=1 Tax=Candidatus Pseudothioglobus singularis PS1 TaxID=1125411 RepID=A0A0M5L0M7_9GAMM|nr:hypothetical protein [Candidatus Pseudothioglobus singularis]ALE02686.1 hypothetical protein W908_04490 [Candidatus Pseudothioglobus singularis PS1]
MKKLLLLLFSLTLSYSALADNIVTGTCVANVREGGIQLLGASNIIEGSELFSVCEEGDILNLSGFRFYDTPEYTDILDALDFPEWEKITERELNNSSEKFNLSLYMARYCDLKETHIIGNEILVCKLVDRD